MKLEVTLFWWWYGGCRLPVNRHFFIWGAREPEFGDGRRGGGGFTDIWSVELSFREDQILQCIGADESPLAFL